MNRRAVLTLMELLVMVLVFALAAAVCLQGFATAAELRRETACYDRAVVLAQNGAEVLKACGGDLPEAAVLLGGSVSPGALTARQEGLALNIQLRDSGIPGLGRADVWVTEEEEILFRLTVSWQEVA